jgi:hypothetical protein
MMPPFFFCHEGRYRPLDFGRIVDAARRGLDAEARRGLLQRTPERLLNGRLGMHKHHDSCDVGYGLFQNLKPPAPIGPSKPAFHYLLKSQRARTGHFQPAIMRGMNRAHYDFLAARAPQNCSHLDRIQAQ